MTSRGQNYDVMRIGYVEIGDLGSYQCQIFDGAESYASAVSEVILKGELILAIINF